jgi:tellurite resistance protein
MPTAPTAGLASSSATAAAARVPASFFSIVLGLGGLSAAWSGASRSFGVSPWLSDALLVLSAVLWVVFFVAQVVKAVSAPGRLRAELEHPVEGSLAGLAPASLLAIAAGTAVHYRDLAQVLFWIGAAAQAVHGVWAVGGWLGKRVDPKLVTPAMYVPAAVGNLLVAAAAGAVGRSEAGWLFFGAGAVGWIVLAAVLLVRSFSDGELAPALRPLLALELAPPAFALVAWLSLQGGASEPTSRALLGVALFVGLVLVRLAGRFRDVPFTASYWAFTFPVAALSTAALRMSSSTPGSIAADLALPLFVVANALIAAIAYKTLVALSRGDLLPAAWA